MKDSFWISPEAEPGAEALFRGTFHLARDGRIQIQMVGASWYQVWLDGKWLLEGPLRYASERPEFQFEEIKLTSGSHVLAIHARHEGVETRILKATPPYLWCRICDQDRDVAIQWKGTPLALQAKSDSWIPTAQPHRINPQLGWVERRDTRLEPDGWKGSEFDDAEWRATTKGASQLPEPVPANLSSVQTFVHRLTPLAEGPLARTFGYENDEPAFAFFSRDRACRDLPVKGKWRLYDLGRVRLGRPSITMDLPAGTVVEMAYAEALTNGRVAPFINLSCGPSCNLDRFFARGGKQTFTPLLPKGGRFLEVHVLGVTSDQGFPQAEYLERCYHPPTEAAFHCGDPLLEKIWCAGAETHRACTEDALTDNPTRERGQWVGDAAATGMDNAAVLFHDLRLCRRSLVQAALCAREDGLVAALSPGTVCHMTSYAFLWVAAVQHYFRCTGDRALLEELWPAAQKNFAALKPFLGPEGLRNQAGQTFIDWGYRVEEPADTATNLFLLGALREMCDWAKQLGHGPESHQKQAEELDKILRTRLQDRLKAGGWKAVGYHSAALGLRFGLVEDETGCLDYLAAHLRDCFPNQPDAPRNDDPLTFEARLITPYFAHYVFPLFLERNRTDFVLEQVRQGWGWLIGDGRTTLPEVFDTRWSHCHQWGGCPTWQMSRYLLGLRPRLDLGPDTFEYCLAPGSLRQARGRLPHPNGGWIHVEWKSTGKTIDYSCRSDGNLRILRTAGETAIIEPGQHGKWEFPIPPKPPL
ncbi:hypothetical protein EBT11_04315 [bacterium]|nr:hypothetical protein [bacterium]NBV96767.1 hypothetical protein [Verrucomicrobiota bacterium]